MRFDFDTESSILARIARRALPQPSRGSGDYRISGLSGDDSLKLSHLVPASLMPAAVLVGLIMREPEPTVLLTCRAPTLVAQGGDICFVGGKSEPFDRDAADTALREAEEEIGLQREFVQLLGFLPDHLMLASGFAVTPVLACLQPGFELTLNGAEVSEAFELPLRDVLDTRNHVMRRRKFADLEFDVCDIVVAGRRIWGGTAGILTSLHRAVTQ